MKLTSPAFDYGEPIPHKYAKPYQNINPPFEILDVPSNTQSFVLTMEDPDVPEGSHVSVWDHWIVFNIPPETSAIREGAEPEGILGTGTEQVKGYEGPDPQDHEHRYFFTIYALDTTLDLPAGATKEQIFAAMQGTVIDSSEIMGTFTPKKEE